MTRAFQKRDVFVFNFGCRHGAPKDFPDIAIERLPILDGHDDARSAAILLEDKKHPGCTNRLEFSTEYAMATHVAANAYWGKAKNAKFIDEKMVSFLLAQATEFMLNSKTQSPMSGDFQSSIHDARRLLALAGKMEECIKTGDSFAGADSSQDYVKQTYEARTERGLKIILARKIPCSCLDDMKATAKATPRGRRCEFCKKEGVHLMKCSQCKVADYCSKTCQKSAWKSHKVMCTADLKEKMFKKK
eukprot:CAMPEP_0198285104 /NCGR_PEP_ID=MMETSP1449-20131203/4418_1 /TAXON_ID=420275 /ORGANISM="Attheya septentrionalis, Strain CCMP2084" /LENGTH=245 /DNA_ID=CAMNT_0043982367 /DNA_START=234 /DNA_END=971 /DNA_ORIENTATION=-